MNLFVFFSVCFSVHLSHAVSAALHFIWLHCTARARARRSLRTCGRHGEQHGGAVHAAVCAEVAAVQTAIPLGHTCELHAHIQVVGAEQPKPLLPARRRGPLGPPALPHQAPGFSASRLLHGDGVHRAAAPPLAAEGHVVVLGGLQRAVGPDRMCGGGQLASAAAVVVVVVVFLASAAAVVVIFFWGLV